MENNVRLNWWKKLYEYQQKNFNRSWDDPVDNLKRFDSEEVPCEVDIEF